MTLPILLYPLRNELHEVQEDIHRLIRNESNQVQFLTQTLAYAVIGLLDLQDAEVMCIGISNRGPVYSVVLIEGRV